MRLACPSHPPPSTASSPPTPSNTFPIRGAPSARCVGVCARTGDSCSCSTPGSRLGVPTWPMSCTCRGARPSSRERRWPKPAVGSSNPARRRRPIPTGRSECDLTAETSSSTSSPTSTPPGSPTSVAGCRRTGPSTSTAKCGWDPEPSRAWIPSPPGLGRVVQCDLRRGARAPYRLSQEPFDPLHTPRLVEEGPDAVQGRSAHFTAPGFILPKLDDGLPQSRGVARWD